jgi:ethanolamine utilization protein EutA
MSCNVSIVSPFNPNDFTSLNAVRFKEIHVNGHWDGSATFFRLQSFSKGVTAGLKEILAKGHPLVLVNDGDIGGIVGLHFQEELKIENPIISIDGISLNDFDYIDIGALIPSSGSVPVVIKSLIFPASPQQ